MHKFQCMKIKACFTWNHGLQGRHYFRAGIGTHRVHGVQVAWDSCTGNMSIILASWNFDTLIAKSRCDKNGHKRVIKKWSQALSPSLRPTITPFSQITHSYCPKPFTCASSPLSDSLEQAMSVLKNIWHP